MTPIIRFLIRYQKILLFLILETIACLLFLKNSNYQQTQVATVVTSFKGVVYKQISKINGYFSLKTENQNLIAENLELRNKLNYYMDVDTIRNGVKTDSLRRNKYTYTSAKIINNSTNKRQNFMILNAGSKQGVRREMGVVSNEGVVGMIVEVSENYSKAISILNTGFIKFSGKLKRTDDYGTISWDGISDKTVQLHDIIQQSDVLVGDTVITNQHSNIFPENILIGTVEKINIKDGIFYEIDIKLCQSLKKLQNVYVIDIHDKDEIQRLIGNE